MANPPNKCLTRICLTSVLIGTDHIWAPKPGVTEVLGPYIGMRLGAFGQSSEAATEPSLASFDRPGHDA